MLMLTQSVSAQYNMYVVDKSGNVKAVSISTVKKVSFGSSTNPFTFSNGRVETTETSISASCSVQLSSDAGMTSLPTTPSVGVCYSSTNITPTVSDVCKTLGSTMGNYTFSLSDLSPGITYYYRVYVKLASIVFYGTVVKAKTKSTTTTPDTGSEDNSKTINGHKFVDLGLPSGLLWAETNIGAELPADGGDYFAWGETSTKSTYDEDSYFDSNYTTYSTDGKTTLEKQHDAAYVNWGTSCRMPTTDEFEELLDPANCTWTWTSMTSSDASSVNGYKVTSISNGNSIFLPVSGIRFVYDVSYTELPGCYWSSTLYSGYSDQAFYLHIESSYFFLPYIYRYMGLIVRPVADP